MSDVPDYKPRKNGETAPGDPKNKNLISVQWKPEDQCVTIEFDNKEFRSFELVIACLDMAKRHVEEVRQAARIQTLQKAQMQAMQEAAIRQKLALG